MWLAVDGTWASCGYRDSIQPPADSDLCLDFPQEVTCWPLDILFSMKCTNKFEVDVVMCVVFQLTILINIYVMPLHNGRSVW